jgi:hypothetical protein
MVRWFPDSPHSYCYYHLIQNLHARFKGSNNKLLRENLEQLFMKVAYSHTVSSYNRNLRNLVAEGKDEIKNFLSELPVEKWCRAFFAGNRYGEMANSTAESFNAWIREERGLPVFDMLEAIRIREMVQNSQRRAEAERWTTILTPTMHDRLNANLAVGRDWTVSCSAPKVFEVHAKFNVKVNLNENFCSCRRWQIHSFPCAHALIAMQKAGEPIYMYIEPYYFSDYFKKSYEVAISPIPSIERDYYESSTGSSIQPPVTKKQAGRPRKKRIRSYGEVSKRPMKCGRCGEVGHHNKTTCTATI